MGLLTTDTVTQPPGLPCGRVSRTDVEGLGFNLRCVFYLWVMGVLITDTVTQPPGLPCGRVSGTGVEGSDLVPVV